MNIFISSCQKYLALGDFFLFGNQIYLNQPYNVLPCSDVYLIKFSLRSKMSSARQPTFLIRNTMTHIELSLVGQVVAPAWHSSSPVVELALLPAEQPFPALHLLPAWIQYSQSLYSTVPIIIIPGLPTEWHTQLSWPPGEEGPSPWPRGHEF